MKKVVSMDCYVLQSVQNEGMTQPTGPWVFLSKIIKTRYANLILSLDLTCRDKLQQTLHVCKFRQVCVSSSLLFLVFIGMESEPKTVPQEISINHKSK